MADEPDRLDDTLDVAAGQHEEARSLGETKPPEYTENDVARRFARRASGTLIYNHSSRCWHVWGGSAWSIDKTGAATERIRRFVEAERDAAIIPRERSAMGRVRFITAVEEIGRSDPLFAVDQGSLDADPWLLGTPEGVVDLRTGIVQFGQPHDLITRRTTVVPATPGTEALVWQAFLREATRGDDELQQFLQRWAGYCLTGDVSEEVLTFVYGSGGNGKGVLLGAISAIMGDYAVSQPMEAFTAGARLPAEYYRAQMAGARLVTASETERGHVWAESQIKELTGNEAPVSARHPHGRPFTYRPQFKLQFVGNHAPKLKARSLAMERRMRIVPFSHKPANPDHGLKSLLQREYPAILRWLIDGCLAWQQQGLGTAQVIQQATDNYFMQQDSFGRWLEERCVLDVMALSRPSALYADYRSWCIANGEAPLTNHDFAEVRDHTPGLLVKTRDGVRWVAGVCLRTPPDYDD